MKSIESGAYPHVSLEQWRSFVSVVEAGGYARASKALHKSQSAITYNVQKIESTLGLSAFEIKGRKATLTPTGHMLYRRARAILTDARDLELAARRLSAGWEAEIGIAVDHLFPSRTLLECLQRLGEESPQTRIEVTESVLSGACEALLEGKAQLAIAAQVPQGFLGDPLTQVRLIPVASPRHALHRVGHALTVRDLTKFRQLVVRDSGLLRSGNAVAVEAIERWTVSQMSTSIEAARSGYGYAWFPEEKIREELAKGELLPLELAEGRERVVTLHLVFADRDSAGPGVLRLADLLRERTAARISLVPNAATNL